MNDGRSTLREAARLSDAFEELSPTAFAVWVKLNEVGRLGPGRDKIAAALGFSSSRSDQILKELERSGYVTLTRGRRKVVVELARRAVISTGRWIVLGGDKPKKPLVVEETLDAELPPEVQAAGARKVQAVDVAKMKGKRKAKRKKPKPKPKPLPEIKVRFNGFSPTDRELRALLKILGRPAKDGSRRGLEEQIGERFSEVYKLYRLRAGSGRYMFGDKDMKVAVSAGVLCLQKGITPAELIEYWQEHVGRFTSMKFPSLSFLSSPKNIDEAACSKGDGAMKTVDSSKHSFTGAGLDPRLREALEGAGFSLNGRDDRYLVSVQSAARALAAGKDIHLSKKVRELAEWAAGNLFSEGKT